MTRYDFLEVRRVTLSNDRTDFNLGLPWLRIVTMSEDRYPRVAYHTLQVLDENGKILWATHIRL